MALVSDVITELDYFFNDATNAKWPAAVKLAAVNAAIDDAWPLIKDIKIDSSITLDSDTFEYTPTASDVEQQWGFSVAYGESPASGTPDIHLRRIRQKRQASGWKILVPADIASALDGSLLYLQYNARVARVSATSDTLYVPIAYAFNFARAWLADSQIAGRSANFNTKGYEERIRDWFALAMQAKNQARRGDLPHEIGMVNEAGRLLNTGRYGQGIV